MSAPSRGTATGRRSNSARGIPHSAFSCHADNVEGKFINQRTDCLKCINNEVHTLRDHLANVISGRFTLKTISLWLNSLLIVARCKCRIHKMLPECKLDPILCLAAIMTRARWPLHCYHFPNIHSNIILNAIKTCSWKRESFSFWWC